MPIRYTDLPPEKRGPVRVNPISYAELTAALMRGDCTLRELADESGLSYDTVCYAVRALRDRKLVHICGWDKDSRGRYILAIYKLGKGKDAPHPGPTSAQSSKATRLRKKQAQLLATTHAQVQAPDQSGHRRHEAPGLVRPGQRALEPAS